LLFWAIATLNDKEIFSDKLTDLILNFDINLSAFSLFKNSFNGFLLKSKFSC